MPALAQEAQGELEITDLITLRYPSMQAVVEVRNVTAVELDQVVVTENGTAVSDRTVERVSETTLPVGIVLAIDISGSMAGPPLDEAKAAARSFVTQKRDQDYIALVAFHDLVEIRSGFTTSQATLLSRIDELQAGGGTALYDAVVLSAAMYSGDAERLQRNMILLTDGNDTDSVAALEEAKQAVLDQEVRTFAVALESEELNLAPLTELVTTLDDLLTTTDPAELSALYGQVQQELDNTLVVRWEATQTTAGDLTVGVSYGTLSATNVTEVPGFIPDDYVAPGQVEVTVPEVVPFTISSSSPVDMSMLRLVGTAAVVIATAVFVMILVRPQTEDAASSFRQRLQAYGRGRGEASDDKKGLIARLGFLKVFTERAEQVARSRGLLSGINSALEQADIALRPGEALAAALGISVLVGIVLGGLTQSIVWAVIAFVVAVMSAFALIRYFGHREKRKFEDQLPDTLTLISTSLRAGYSLLQAVEAVAAEAPSPTSREFGRAISEARLGRPVVDSLDGIAERMQSEDFSWAVMSIEIQREVGGNLAEVLNIVADTMRQRNRLRGEIKALTAEGRISALVLGLMPFALFAFLFVTNPSYLQPLITSTAGWVAIGVGAALMLIGGYWLSKIVDIEV